MHRFVIDTDVGAYDAVAIMLALRHPDVAVEAIYTVAGNVGVEQATRNALTITDLCDARVPVYAGMGQPMLREPSNAQEVHGQDGLGDLDRDMPYGKPEQTHAVDALIQHILDAPLDITLVTLGPLTNVALALLKEPAVAHSIREIFVMGGTVNALGNVTPSAEFNIWADPEAAKLVFHSGAPVTMVGWELVWGDMLLRQSEMDRLRASGSKLAAFAVDCNQQVIKFLEGLLGEPAIALPGAIAMAIAIDPGICRTETHFVTVETTSELTRGETVVDRWQALGQPPNVTVCFEPNADRFKRMLFDLLT